MTVPNGSESRGIKGPRSPQQRQSNLHHQVKVQLLTGKHLQLATIGRTALWPMTLSLARRPPGDSSAARKIVHHGPSHLHSGSARWAIDRSPHQLIQHLLWPGAKVTAQLVKTLHSLPSGLAEPSPPGVLAGQENPDSSQTPDAPTPQQSLLQQSTHNYSDTALQSLLTGGFISSLLTIIMSYVPILHELPIFGAGASRGWLWSIDLSPGFIGQFITGPAIPLHMLAGAAIGWGILSPYAKAKYYAPGPVDDWEHG
ncbi:hypothetical protein S7711_02943 [Stachybotrys chartarum IBT 7711]|uniref:Uncharacterized protein n=1 Tax=Stachybotrys chartarum (strain CBS 109288 / IBT 7711) TaxID=1280523 RepID=A0A084B2D5_STACB|nr:hypothetical protein S7711_02943 [Stachybotrys chartarum IBT 7711]